MWRFLDPCPAPGVGELSKAEETARAQPALLLALFAEKWAHSSNQSTCGWSCQHMQSTCNHYFGISKENTFYS